jgi:hypothetical protein
MLFELDSEAQAIIRMAIREMIFQSWSCKRPDETPLSEFGTLAQKLAPERLATTLALLDVFVRAGDHSPAQESHA